ncbi:MAG TPA: MHS family MFS transporter [Candidatus Agrococcus pullicola]|uniref:MHS family MFS transporter n=1 Tax=Candidatus Agrococcus pullicola TaxID=2838429 RepID=A0A9D2C9G2_9MICO|nr:MHS family MFS transporter [Candidatus Agrococcus pullicola]
MTSETTTAPQRRAARRAAAAALVGTLIEWYDFALYGAAAALIFNVQFFGASDQLTGLLSAFATFAVGYFARPIGGIVFGHLGDRIGRKPVMIITLLIMGLSTAAMGLLPTYASIGIWAAILLVILRIVQGLGAGAEYAGAITLSAEASTKGRRGYYSSWSGVGLWLGSALGLLTFQALVWMMGDAFFEWGWRIPFVASIIVVAVSLFIRLKVAETHTVRKTADTSVDRVPLLRLLATEKRRLAVALGSNFLLSGFTYIPQVWALSYLTNNLGIAASIALAINAAFFIVGAPFLPFFGRVGDRIGRRRLFTGAAVFAIAWTVPMFLLMDTRNPWLIAFALVTCWVGVAATGVAAQGAFLTELFPPETRFSGVAFARELTGAILGGLAPLIATALFAATNHWWAIAIFMIANALVTLVAVRLSKHFRSDADQDHEITDDARLPDSHATSVD